MGKHVYKQQRLDPSLWHHEFQIVDLRSTLRFLVVPIKGRTFLFGDNQALLKKCHYPLLLIAAIAASFCLSVINCGPQHAG
jgi:hypothetical protein